MIPSEAASSPLLSEPQGAYGLVIPTKSEHARGKTQPLGTHRYNLFWDMSFGAAQAAQKFGASHQEFSQSYLPVVFRGL